MRVIFLPGAAGDGGFWRPLIGLLDWPGLGAVPPSPDVNGFDDLVRLTLHALDEPADLVAQSMGGVVALRVALERPDLVRRLVLVATSGGIDVTGLGAADWRPDSSPPPAGGSSSSAPISPAGWPACRPPRC